ncbi:hypothetical protein V6R21_18635 [Limibacter armeniacum]|uniref:hypothetical protein n=1 Tax=Limibacter armeniacum TaxID=466084 RepID=UPI002FE510E6
MKKNYKLTLWLVSFIIILFAGDRLLSAALMHLVDSSEFRYSRMYRGEAQCDILLVGNSRGLPLYQPYIENETGKKTFNISYNGLPTKVALPLLEDYFEMYEPPKTVLIEATMGGQRPELTENFKLYTDKSERLRGVLMDTNPKALFFSEMFHLYKFNSEVFQRSLYYMDKSDTTWLNDRVINTRLLDKKYMKQFDVKLDERAVDDFNKIIDLCKSKGSEVHFIVSPYYPEFRNTASNFDAYKEALSERIGHPLYDYSLLINDPTAFADYLHINKKGSKTYIKKMHEDGILISLN